MNEFYKEILGVVLWIFSDIHDGKLNVGEEVVCSFMDDMIYFLEEVGKKSEEKQAETFLWVLGFYPEFEEYFKKISYFASKVKKIEDLRKKILE